MIEINGLNYVYPSKKGIYDVTFSVKKGEVFGYLGPNGAGKTTTIRSLLGFVAPAEGSCRINGLDCWKDACEIQKMVGYLPGEMNLLDSMNGIEFLKFMGDMRCMKDFTRMDSLIERFDLDTSGKIKKMSKGMKQKLGIIAAFMHDPDVYILDEPTSGLDPLMQIEFSELIDEENKKGKTILMSSHIFEEVQKSCSRVGIIKDGRIAAIEDVKELIAQKTKTYLVTLGSSKDVDFILKSEFESEKVNENTVKISTVYPFKDFYKMLLQCDVISLDSQQMSLENAFMKYYSSKEDK
ncbi:MAG: ABC transporter ATP-binding protein [Eubacteriales bacterium]